MRVLDLCAAPGGKTSQLASALAGQGLLVANEYVAARAEILKSNLERMGVSNAVVLNESPERIAAALPAFFDRILVDAPCSGEGMFRKEPAAPGPAFGGPGGPVRGPGSVHPGQRRGDPGPRRRDPLLHLYLCPAGG